MLFDVSTVNSNNEVETWLYDSSNNDLWTPNGTLIERPEVDEEKRSSKKSRLIGQVTIQLGLACNQKCVYCLQHQRENEEKPKSHADLHRLIDQLKTLQFTDNASIDLWGGEPLVYWKTLEKLIPMLREFLPNNARIYMTSNCTLLTREKVDFLQMYKVALLLSHDGKFNLITRGYELSKTAYDACLYLLDKYNPSNPFWMKFCYNSVITDYNADLSIHAEWMKKHFPGIEPLRQQPLFNINESYVNKVRFTKTQIYVQTSIDRYYNHGETRPFRNLLRRVESDMTFKRKSNGVNSIGYRCGIFSPNYLCVDLNGNMLYCHNDLTSFGDLDHYESAVAKLHETLDRKACKNCVFNGLCKGGCPLHESVGDNCGYFPMYQVLFFLFMKEHFGVNVIGVKPHEV